MKIEEELLNPLSFPFLSEDDRGRERKRRRKRKGERKEERVFCCARCSKKSIRQIRS